MKLEEAIYNLHAWFKANNVPTESLTLILNIRDEKAAAAFEGALKKDIAGPLSPFVLWSGDISTHEFKLCGLSIRVESPFHAEPRR